MFKKSDEFDWEDPTGGWTIVVRPARMDACIAADQLSVVHGQPVRVAGIRNEVHRLEDLAGGGIVPRQTRAVLAIPLTVVAYDLPDAAVVPGDAVVTNPVRSLVERDHEFRFPGLGIY